MTKPEVQAVLDKIANDWQGAETTLADVPLERIDRDNSNVLGRTFEHDVTPELYEMNYVGAASTSQTDTPVGTEYDLQTDRVVSVRVVGAHVDEGGAIDPQKGTADEASVSYNTRDWDSLIEDVRRSILVTRLDPSVGRANVSYKDLFVENAQDLAQDYGNAYLWTADVRFSGFETLP